MIRETSYTLEFNNGMSWSIAFLKGLFLACLFSKKMSRYCHSPAVFCIIVVITLMFSNISVITEDICLKLKLVVHYQKGNHTSWGGSYQIFLT